MSIFSPSQSQYRQSYRAAAFRRDEVMRSRRSSATALKLQFEFGPMAIIVTLLLLSVTMALMYLAHFNQDATKGYEMRRLEADRQQLLAQYDLSDMHLAETKTMDRIVNSDKVVHMKPVRRVTFVSGNMALASADRL